MPHIKLKKAAKEETAARKAHANKKHSAQRDSATLTLERRSSDRRGADERRKTDAPVAVERRQLERRVKVSRRRQIDPTTCERDYSDNEVEFMAALEQYKRTSGRMFPTCSEVLEVLLALGYEKRPPAEPAPVAEIDPQTQPVSIDPPAKEGSIFGDVPQG